MPRVYIYNVEENTRNQFDLEMPTGYDIDWVSFKLLDVYLILGSIW
jgi:hypothetical protein